MKLMLDVINEETGEVRGEVKIDANVLRECREEVDQTLYYPNPHDKETMRRLRDLLDGILDVAEVG
jgi:hypothetical protein